MGYEAHEDFKEEQDSGFISDELMEHLVMSLARGVEEEGFTEDDLKIVTRWATEIIVGDSILELVGKGHIDLRIKDGKVAFSCNLSEGTLEDMIREI